MYLFLCVHSHGGIMMVILMRCNRLVGIKKVSIALLITLCLTSVSIKVYAESKKSFVDLANAIYVDIAAERLSYPPGNNALDKLVALKQQFPNDNRISQYTELLLNAYVKRFDTLIKSRNYTDAALLIPKIEVVSPYNEKVKSLLHVLVSETNPIKKHETAHQQPVKVKSRFVEKTLKKHKAIRPPREKQNTVKKNILINSEVNSLKDDNEMFLENSASKGSVDWVNQRPRSETLDTFYIRSRGSFSEASLVDVTLKPVCENIVQKNASVKIHTVSEKDYRWLMVKLMLCTRKINKAFWLRHSYVVSQSNFLKVTLHPSRNAALELTQSSSYTSQ